MKFSKNISGSLIVCVAAGAFAAGALFVEPADSPSSAVAAPAASEHATAGGYGASANAAIAATIEISNFEISVARVAPGATVTVVNRDDTAHTVTARDGAFSSGSVRGGSSVTFVAPDEPGSYAVFCEIHPSMKSTLTVG